MIVGGHLDSWDLGDGSQDDGAVVVQSMAVLQILKKLNYKPKNSLRVVLFMNEENGGEPIHLFKFNSNKLSLRPFIYMDTSVTMNGVTQFLYDRERYDYSKLELLKNGEEMVGAVRQGKYAHYVIDLEQRSDINVNLKILTEDKDEDFLIMYYSFSNSKPTKENNDGKSVGFANSLTIEDAPKGKVYIGVFAYVSVCTFP
jgi:Zn-dependent M28 family amino/carboxypeptidase